MLRSSSRPGFGGSIVLGVLSILSGCGGSPAPTMVGGPGPQEGPVLTVTNHHPHHVEVTVVPDQSSSIRLGTVRVESTRRMHIPRTVDGLELQLRLRCVRTGEIYATRHIRPARGDRVSLSVESLLRLSDFQAR